MVEKDVSPSLVASRACSDLGRHTHEPRVTSLWGKGLGVVGSRAGKLIEISAVVYYDMVNCCTAQHRKVQGSIPFFKESP